MITMMAASATSARTGREPLLLGGFMLFLRLSVSGALARLTAIQRRLCAFGASGYGPRQVHGTPLAPEKSAANARRVAGVSRIGISGPPRPGGPPIPRGSGAEPRGTGMLIADKTVLVTGA